MCSLFRKVTSGKKRPVRDWLLRTPPRTFINHVERNMKYPRDRGMTKGLTYSSTQSKVNQHEGRAALTRQNMPLDPSRSVVASQLCMLCVTLPSSVQNSVKNDDSLETCAHHTLTTVSSLASMTRFRLQLDTHVATFHPKLDGLSPNKD